MAQGRDATALWKLALKKNTEGPRWMELVRHALTESNPDAKKEQLSMVSRYLLMRQMVAEDKADAISEMRASLKSEDHSKGSQPLDLDAIEEYLESEREDDDEELVQEFQKNIQQKQAEQLSLEDEILKSTTEGATGPK